MPPPVCCHRDAILRTRSRTPPSTPSPPTPACAWGRSTACTGASRLRQALIHIRRAFTQGSEDTPKSGRARAVPTIDQTARVLDELSRRDHHIGDDDLVFV
jgi:hypothetical protein